MAFTTKDVSTQFHTYLNMKVTSSQIEFVKLMQFEGVKPQHRSVVLEESRVVSPVRSVLQITKTETTDTASGLTNCLLRRTCSEAHWYVPNAVRGRRDYLASHK